jgi:hypothetical protein
METKVNETNTTDDLKKDMADLKTPEEKAPVAAKKKPVRKVKAKTTAKAAAPAKKANGADHVTLKQLCKEYKLEPRIARRKLRLAGLKPEGRWSWEKGSSALKKAETTLQAKAD